MDEAKGRELGLSPYWRTVLISAIGFAGGFAAVAISLWLGVWLTENFEPLRASQVPKLVEQAWWVAFFYNFCFVAIAYISIQAIARVQNRQEAERYRSRLRDSGLLEDIRDGTADFGLVNRVASRQMWPVSAMLRGLPEPTGDRYKDIGLIGLFLDLHLEGGRNHRTWLRPTPVFMFAPFIAIFVTMLASSLQLLLPEELRVFYGLWMVGLLIVILMVLDQLSALGIAWHRMLLEEMGPEFREQVRLHNE